LRLRLLSLLTGQAMSAAEAARRIGGTQANASYHLRVLHAAGLLDIVERQSVRGGQSVRYRHDPRSGDQRHDDGPEAYTLLAESVAGELRRRSAQRERGAPGVITDAELWVPLPEWEAFVAVVKAASLRLHSAARPVREPGTVRVSATMAVFRMRRQP
jgi:DNA-binding transcriptional ArsR family regulator